MLRQGFFRSLLALVVLAILAGCTPATALVGTPTDSVRQVPSTMASTQVPAASPTPEQQALQTTPTNELATLPKSQPSATRPASGWTTYSNPDFIKGLAVQENML